MSWRLLVREPIATVSSIDPVDTPGSAIGPGVSFEIIVTPDNIMAAKFADSIPRCSLVVTVISLVSALSGDLLLFGQTQVDYFSLSLHEPSKAIRQILVNHRDVGERNIVFLIDPMKCPRCEGAAYTLMRSMERRQRKGALLTLVSYPRMNAAVSYARFRKFPTTMVIDTSGSVFRELGIQSTVPFVTVWDSTGVLLFAKAIYGINVDDSLLFWNIDHANMRTANQQSGDAAIATGAESVGMDDVDQSWRAPHLGFRVHLAESTSQPVGILAHPILSPDKKQVLATDQLSLTVKIFDSRTGALIHEVTPSYEIRKMYSPDLGKSEFLRYEREGIAHTMFFGGYFDRNGRYHVSASIPEFLIHADDATNGHEESVDYYNAAVLSELSIDSGTISSVRRLYPDLNADLKVSHASMTPVFDARRNEIAVVTGKGYPFVGTNSSEASGAGDPMNPEFYRNAPLFAVFSMKTGKLVRYIGELDSVHRLLGTGYAFVMPRIAIDGGRYYMAQNLVSRITTSDGRSIKLKSYFNPDLERPRVARSTLPTIPEIRHLTDSSGAMIPAIGVRNGRMYVLWYVKKAGVRLVDDYYIVCQRYNVASGRLEGEWSIPRSGPDGMMSDIALQAAQNQVLVVYQTPSSSSVVGYELR